MLLQLFIFRRLIIQICAVKELRCVVRPPLVLLPSLPHLLSDLTTRVCGRERVREREILS